MSLVKKILAGWGLGGRRGGEEHSVTVHLELTGGAYGSEDEVEEIRLLGDDCEAALKRTGAGVFEGEEFGGSECVLVFAGPDAGRLWDVIAPILEGSRVAGGGHAQLRYGGPGAREVREPLTTR